MHEKMFVCVCVLFASRSVLLKIEKNAVRELYTVHIVCNRCEFVCMCV